MVLMRKGIENRRVAHTKMNRESSRSHSVLTLTIESKTKNYSGMTVSKFSRLNLIDLAGGSRMLLSCMHHSRIWSPFLSHSHYYSIIFNLGDTGNYQFVINTADHDLNSIFLSRERA